MKPRKNQKAGLAAPIVGQPDPNGVPALPTLQLNALRRIFERPTFTPEEVAQLGYPRLRRAEGVGQKGLDTIVAWLQDCGHELKLPARPQAKRQAPSVPAPKLEQALCALRSNGYIVYRRRSDEAVEPEFTACS